MIRRFISYYKPHRKLFYTDMLCAFIVAVCDLFYPIIAKSIIDDFVPNRNFRMLIVWAGTLLCIYLVKAGLNYYIQYYGHVMGVRMQGDMRKDIFRRLQKLPFSFFDENKTGVIMSRIINDLMDISELAHHGPEDLFLSLVMLIGSFVMLSRINLLLTIIIFATLPFIVFFSAKMRHAMTTSFTKTREELAEVNAALENSIAGIRVSRAYVSQDAESQRFEKYNESFKKARSASYKVMGIFMSGMTLFTDILYLVVLAAGGAFYFNGSITSGDFVAYLLYVSMFLNPIRRLIQFFEQYQNGMTGFMRFEKIMEENEEPEAEHPVELGRVQGEVRFEDVSFSYKEDDGDTQVGRVIDHLSMEIPQGQKVALVGPSGGGKTTICHLIPRFYEIMAGCITIDGHDITELSRASLRRNIGIVAQDVFLFTGTIRENIAYGNLDASDDEIVEAAKMASIHDFILSLDEGYDTFVGERGIKLSGGQKQRISIARAFLKNPPILILDEATSALDNATEIMIQDAIERLSKGKTVLVVAHRLSTIRNADKIIVLMDGRIAEQGAHDELLQQDGIYASLYQSQFRT